MSFRTNACKEIIGLLGRVPKKPVKVGKPNINHECSVAGKKLEIAQKKIVESELQRVKEFNHSQSDLFELDAIGVHVEYGEDYLVSQSRYNGKKHTTHSKNPFKKFCKGALKHKCAKFLSCLDVRTLEELNKMEYRDFITNSRRIICKKLGIPENLIPQFISIPEYAFPMAFTPLHNGIVISSSNFRNLFTKNISSTELTKLINERANIFGMIKHELTHAKQVLDIFRTKGIGEKAVNRFGKANANLVCADIKRMAETLTEQQLQSIAAHPNFGIIMQYRALLKQSPELAEKYLADVEKNTANSFISMLNERRQLIISEMGEISAKSKTGKNAKQDLRYLARGANQDATQNVKGYERYFNKRAETEAHIIGELGTLEYLCPDFEKKLSMIA